MQTSQPNVFARDHTIFGVCEALGEDFGFNPVWLRVPLAVCLLLNPTAVVATYLAAGVVVFASRWLAPNPKAAPAAEPAAEPAPAAMAEQAEPDLAIAA